MAFLEVCTSIRSFLNKLAVHKKSVFPFSTKKCPNTHFLRGLRSFDIQVRMQITRSSILSCRLPLPLKFKLFRILEDPLTIKTIKGHSLNKERNFQNQQKSKTEFGCAKCIANIIIYYTSTFINYISFTRLPIQVIR